MKSVVAIIDLVGALGSAIACITTACDGNYGTSEILLVVFVLFIANFSAVAE